MLIQDADAHTAKSVKYELKESQIMIGAIFSNTTVPVLEQVAAFTEARHNVLAGNLANADTPGYRVRDLSAQGFQSRLKSAIAARHAPASLQSQLASLGQGGNLVGAPVTASLNPALAIARVNDNLSDLLHHDDSNVSLERQVSEITKNQLRHNLALSIMTAQFRLLEAAISERA